MSATTLSRPSLRAPSIDGLSQRYAWQNDEVREFREAFDSTGTESRPTSLHPEAESVEKVQANFPEPKKPAKRANWFDETPTERRTRRQTAKSERVAKREDQALKLLDADDRDGLFELYRELIPWFVLKLQRSLEFDDETFEDLSQVAHVAMWRACHRFALEALQSRQEKAKKEGFDPSEVPLVFPNTIGRHLRSSNFNRMVWNPIRDAVGIRQTTTFHDLRHTQASLMLYAGVDMKVIQERLGHADFATTANMYAHLMQDSQARATEQLAAMMEAAKPVATLGGYTKNPTPV